MSIPDQQYNSSGKAATGAWPFVNVKILHNLCRRGAKTRGAQTRG